MNALPRMHLGMLAAASKVGLFFHMFTKQSTDTRSQLDLGNGTFKCFYDWSGEGGQPQDNHCTYDVKGNCGADHNYNKCKSQAAPRHRSRAPSPPTAGHAAPRALKQLKIKRDQS